LTIFKIEYGKVQIFDDALSIDLYRELLSATQSIGWRFGWNTPSNPNTRYWHHEVGRGVKENTQDISENVRQHPLRAFGLYQDWLLSHLVPADTKILRYYLNAHTYGTDGWPHTDTDRNDELTAILYLNMDWKPEWCGETVVFNANGDIAASVLPHANRIMTFPSNALHAPRPLSKSFEDLRKVLVVKMGAPRDGSAFFRGRHILTEEENRHLNYLIELGADKRNQSIRTLLQHFWGTYNLLKMRNADHDLCIAGLYHAIYGTSVFRADIPVDRENLRARIGERSERLVWLFCSLKRPQCWQIQGDSLPLINGGNVTLTPRERADLILLERANLDEQGILTPYRRAGID